MLRDNMWFCENVDGPRGKGPRSGRLGITHFVDDKDDAMWAVFVDVASNAGASILRHNCQLFHFARSAVGNGAAALYLA